MAERKRKMNKLFSKIAALSVGLAMAIGVGVAVGSQGRKASVVKAASGSWEKASSIAADDVVVFVCEGVSKELTSISTTSTKYGIGSSYTSSPSGTYSFTVESGSSTGSYSFKNGSKYLNWETGNSLNTDGTSKSGNTSWTVSFTDGNATVLNAADSARQIWWNVNSPRFACYTGKTAGSSYYSIQLYKWVPDISSGYSVIYNANASTSRPASDIPNDIDDLEDNETVNLTGSPTRWGYSFAGWATSASGTTAVSSVTIDGANVNVYAIWQEDHTVKGAWSDNPYTVEEVMDAIDVDKSKTYPEVYVTGIICQVDSFNSQYGSITYWISDDGETTTKFEVYGGLGLNSAKFASINSIETGATVVLCGNAKYYSSGNVQVYEYDLNSYQISYTAPAHSIDFTFEPSTYYAAGTSGSFTYECEVEGVTATFASSASDIIEVNSSTGAYQAKAAGTATITLTLTKGSDSDSKEATIKVVANKTVSEAYSIASELDSGKTTTDYYYVCGSVSSLDADGKARAINFTDGAKVIEVFFGGGNPDYSTVTSSAKIGSKVSVFGRIQNYNGTTYEITNVVLDSVVTGDAVSYSEGAYKSLDASCEIGVNAVTEAQWTELAEGFAALPAAEQAKLQEEDPSSYGEIVVSWINRYEIIASNTALSNFMSRANVVSRISVFENAANESNAMIIIIAIAAVSAIAFTTLLVLKKRKHN